MQNKGLYAQAEGAFQPRKRSRKSRPASGNLDPGGASGTLGQQLPLTYLSDILLLCNTLLVLHNAIIFSLLRIGNYLQLFLKQDKILHAAVESAGNESTLDYVVMSVSSHLCPYYTLFSSGSSVIPDSMQLRVSNLV